ncbi:hypothetical protein [Elioraea rosea]|uniref:hypothetical protein n=1 Tax=Elioraea rosea TaxID=2492390 RepID=UPI001183FF37|nr:hypothetical protein [Elioraea rosea]
MTKLSTTALALALLVGGAAPAFASAEAPVEGTARPLVAAQHVGGNGDAAPSFGQAYATVGTNPNVRIVASGPSFDVIPLALAPQAGSRG